MQTKYMVLMSPGILCIMLVLVWNELLFYYEFLAWFFFFLIYLFIYLFLAALALCYCARAFSSCGEQGLFFVAVRGLLIAVASLVAEHGLQVRGLQQLWLSGSRAQAQQLWCTGLVVPRHVVSSRPGIEPMSPALAGGFLTTVPPGKSFSLF